MERYNPPMLRRGLVRAAAGATVLAAVVSGLAAVPAQAATGGGTAAGVAVSKPKPSKPSPVVSVTTPKVSLKDYRGACPVTLTFTAKVRVKVNGKLTLAYRWLRGDGSKSKVKTRVVRGRGVRTVAVAEKATFRKDIKGWQALQVLSPRKVTTKKGYFSVSCHGPARPPVVKKPQPKPKPPAPRVRPPKYYTPAYAKAWVHVPDYVGECPPSSGVTAKGVIKVSRPTLVKYRWIHNGKVVDRGTIKVIRDKKVSYTFKPNKSHRGWVTLDIVSPRFGGSDRDGYRVKCKKEEPPPPAAQASASVTAPDDYTGACPINRVFNGTITLDRIDAGGTTVQYRWAGPGGFAGPAQTLAFAEGDPLSKSVSHTVEVTGTGIVQRWIEILSPNGVVSNTGEVRVECQPLTIQVVDLRRSIDSSACDGTPGHGPAVIVSARIQVNGPVRVEYEWDFNEGVIVVPGSFETTGPDTVTVSHRLESSTLTGSGVMRARIRITSHDARGAASDFTPPPCPTS